MKRDSTEIMLLRKSQINNAITRNFRQYFIGNLKNPQELDYIELGDLEIGTSLYQNPKADKPHFHEISSEIIYILKGTYKILLINTGLEYTLNAGDFFVIPAKSPYIGKAVKKMTQTLFIKMGGNDKVEVPENDDILKWMEESE